MLKHFKYQGILSEVDEMMLYNDLTEIAIEKADYDSFMRMASTVVQSRTSEKNNELYQPLITNAWNAVYDEYGRHRNVNMRYRKYTSSDLTELCLEELIYLHLELASEYIVDLSILNQTKMGLMEQGSYAYIDSYKNIISSQVEKIRNIINKHEASESFERYLETGEEEDSQSMPEYINSDEGDDEDGM